MSKQNDASNGRREFLKASTIIALGGLINYSLGAEAELKHSFDFMDKPAFHNMLIVGKETVFASHFPMFKTSVFDSPHRYQVILEVALTKPGNDPQSLYFNDRKNNPATKIYCLGPGEFPLPNLIAANAEPAIKSFQATIFRGHLEKPGKRILMDEVDVSVKKIIHFREFDPGASRLPQLEYILFGKGQELFLAHFITRPPDFDQVLSIACDHSFTDQELSQGMHVVFERPNSIAERLLEKQEAFGAVQNAGRTASPVKVKFKAVTEFYFEEGELRVPADFKATPAEIIAGFR